MSYVDGDSLLVRIRCAFGADISDDPDTWEWTDITQWWHTPDEVSIEWGRSPRAEEPETSTLNLTLKNHDGRFSAGHPASPYWPNVEPWTPITYDVDLGDGDGWRNRFAGYVRKWPVTWPGGSRHVAHAQIEAVGELARQGRGSPPSLSPMHRTIASSTPVAYWPLEDGAASSVAGSALPGQPPMTGIGSPAFVAVDSLPGWPELPFKPGSDGLVDLAGGGTLRGTVVAAPATTWTISVMASVNYADLSGDVVIAEVATPGSTYTRWRLIYRTSLLETHIVAYTPEGAATTVITDPGVYSSLQLYTWSMWQDGGTIRLGYIWRPDLGSYAYTGSVSGTLGQVTSVVLNPTRTTATSPMPFGHVAVWARRPDPVTWMTRDSYGRQIYGAPLSWAYEPATDRLLRLCAEAGIDVDVPAVTQDEAAAGRMGSQPIATLRELLAQCEAADGGLLYERGHGLGYLPRARRYNPPVALVLDAALGQIGQDINPVYDDQSRNWVRVERVDGGSAVDEDPDLVRRQGRVPTEPRLALATDDGLLDRASWTLHLVSSREPRYESLSANLSTHRQLAGTWCGLRPGTRVRVLNPPPQAGGLGDQLVVGATEVYRGRRSWRATMRLEPAAPWLVGVWGESRYGAVGSRLVEDLDGSATMLQVDTPAGPWTVDPVSQPLDLQVGSERVTAGLPPLVDTFVRSVSGGWGGSWSVAMGSAPAYSVNGSQGVIGLTGSGRHGIVHDIGAADQDVSVLISVPATATGGTIFHGWMMRYTDSDNHLYLEAQFRTDGRIWLGLYSRVLGVNSTLVTPVDIMAYSGGTEYRLDLRAVGDRYQARIYSGSAPGWQVSAVPPGALRGTATGPRALLAGANSNTQPVAVTVDTLTARASAVGPTVWDGFARTEVDQWGTPPVGPTWTHLGSATAFRVGSGSGHHLHSVVNTGRHSFVDVGSGNCMFRFLVAAPVAASGMPLTAYAVARPNPSSPTDDQYQVRIAWLTDGRITCTVRKREGGTPDSKSNVALPVSYVPGDFWWVQMQVDGATIRGKVWQHGTVEPAWQTGWTDPDPLPETWTQVGVTTLTETGSTNTHPIEYQIRAFQVLDPQIITVERGVNGIQRSWQAGTDVNLWQPRPYAL